jgi:hypothetical protein
VRGRPPNTLHLVVPEALLSVSIERLNFGLSEIRFDVPKLQFLNSPENENSWHVVIIPEPGTAKRVRANYDWLVDELKKYRKTGEFER